MSTYRVEWPCCGSVTETDAWEPESCPFCAPADGAGVLKLKATNAELLEALTIAKARIDDMLASDDGQAWKEAQKALPVIASVIAKATGGAA